MHLTTPASGRTNAPAPPAGGQLAAALPGPLRSGWCLRAAGRSGLRLRPFWGHLQRLAHDLVELVGGHAQVVGDGTGSGLHGHGLVGFQRRIGHVFTACAAILAWRALIASVLQLAAVAI